MNELTAATDRFARRIYIVEFKRRPDGGLFAKSGAGIVAELINREPVVVHMSGRRFFTNIDSPKRTAYDIAVEFVMAELNDTLAKAEMILNLMGFRRFYRAKQDTGESVRNAQRKSAEKVRG